MKIIIIIRMGIRSYPTRNNDNKVAKMGSDCLKDTKEFYMMNAMQRIDVEGPDGIYLVMSLDMFSRYIMSQSNTNKDGHERLLWSP